MSKHKHVNLWFAELTLKRCPNCKRDTKGPVCSWYEYVSNRRLLVDKFCDNCFDQRVPPAMKRALAIRKWTSCTLVRSGGTSELFTNLQSQINTWIEEERKTNDKT